MNEHVKIIRWKRVQKQNFKEHWNKDAIEAMNKQFEYQLEKEEFSHETPLEINHHLEYGFRQVYTSALMAR